MLIVMEPPPGMAWVSVWVWIGMVVDVCWKVHVRICCGRE